MHINFLAVLVAALVPMIIGYIWYNPKVFGTAWMKASGMTEEKIKTGNMAVIFGVSFLLSFMLSFFLQSMVIHQMHFGSMLFGTTFQDPNTEIGAMFKTIMDQYGTAYRTFKHGAFHGFLGGIFVATPIMAINSLFEIKGFKYIAINCGYWIVSLMLMGGILSGWM